MRGPASFRRSLSFWCLRQQAFNVSFGSLAKLVNRSSHAPGGSTSGVCWWRLSRHLSNSVKPCSVSILSTSIFPVTLHACFAFQRLQNQERTLHDCFLPSTTASSLKGVQPALEVSMRFCFQSEAAFAKPPFTPEPPSRQLRRTPTAALPVSAENSSSLMWRLALVPMSMICFGPVVSTTKQRTNTKDVVSTTTNHAHGFSLTQDSRTRRDHVATTLL